MDTVTQLKAPTFQHHIHVQSKEGSLLKIRRALISVSDKQGIGELANCLKEFGVEIVSTGGTHRALREAGASPKSVSEITGFPEILDGRVKTLHPAIHAGILAVRDNPLHLKQLHEHNLEPIDLVVVNLYPFEQTIHQPGTTLEEAIEQIDIGGPAMVRAAAKNYMHTTVVVNPGRYQALMEELRANDGAITPRTRFELAQEAFQYTASYDAVISTYLGTVHSLDVLPDVVTISMKKSDTLRYGENPHQAGALYGTFNSFFKKLHGRELSYNNILDVNAGAMVCSEFEKPAVVIIKHNNPCGVGSAESMEEAYNKALATDAKSAFGGIIVTNRPLTLVAAERINDLFTEVIVAPGFAENVLEFLMQKKDRRVIQQVIDVRSAKEFDIRGVVGGLLVQEQDQVRMKRDNLRTVTQRKPTDPELEAMLFAWRVAKHVKSNAIVYARGDRTLGIGAGQMSRVDSSRIAAMKAKEAGFDLTGCAVASDAFFPFADGLLEAIQAGATAVIQPGGSVRDEEVIKVADENGIAMVFTGIRHFRH